MNTNRRSTLVYGLLLVVWLVVVGWQLEEHSRVEEAARTGLRYRSNEIANTLSAFLRALRFRNTVLQDRLEPVLKEMVYGSTNQLVTSSDLISVALLNTTNGVVVSAGEPIDLSHTEIIEKGEYWAANTVTFVNPIEGAKVTPEGTNQTATVVIPSPPPGFTNNFRGPGRGFPRSGEDRPPPFDSDTNGATGASGNPTNPPDGGFGPGGRSRGDRRPPWLRGMDEQAYKALILTRELHGLVLAMSTAKYRAASEADLWLRGMLAFFATISALGLGLAWRSIAKSSELQIRLIRASELNTHLREMNLAAAGLAHETRNPLNIIRGMAQILSKSAGSTPELQEKSQAIVNQTDKVTAQLNEFINYSRPREVRPTRVALAAAVQEVVRTLGFDIEEKQLKVETVGDPLCIEADEQLLRQLLFNLLMNAVQATTAGGHVWIVTRKSGAAAAVVEIRDDGAGVPEANRAEIYKPYFTTNPRGTGLGLAVVQQIVLAHGWEITCLPNQPRGTIFRVNHLKVVA